ncbi:tetratricopeptide repeat protein [Saccharopolyspora phatthalungensis]|uniref:Tetratricopeptide (TPR) repeat protein n=1 Tax=Saccharopolyspora phatthalungensis TaxID=664693 RepID=A0A840QGE4_9PSEU|nr:tetratricopeptide repeat protein [Saccharopolyspora phatthalungensis]MBB5159546.1 tetratricopeptide (TPR) repeat protein [Saccharopolyspora phatthalungensis]
MSRAELAEAVNRYLWDTTGKRHELDAHAIARYERGDVRWPSAHYRSGFRAVLGAATDADLGFHPTRRGNTTTPTRAERTTRSVPDYCGRIDLGASPTEFLASTTVDTPLPKALGWTEVEHVRATTRAVALSENFFGGGLSCDAAVAQLRWAGQLLEIRASKDVYHAMAEAVGNLASVVAYSAFDIAKYSAADRCFEFALWCADEGGSWQLRANTLAEMARKAAYLGELDDALSLIELAQVRADRLTATARAMLRTLRARLLALIGRHDEAQADVERADAHFQDSDPGTDPPWLCYYDAAEHQGSTGKALIPIAQSDHGVCDCFSCLVDPSTPVGRRFRPPLQLSMLFQHLGLTGRTRPETARRPAVSRLPDEHLRSGLRALRAGTGRHRARPYPRSASPQADEAQPSGRLPTPTDLPTSIGRSTKSR